ncbi:MAG: DUF1957 domain-containing protein [Spirochaetaceae bacterium]|jgi:1,4-alpha-glucan branching enzyme|nr:DUF1957 domain-containing protein [Spirochaetaceae bacterium]
MSEKNVISFVFHANLPFVRESESRFVYEEMPFFETLSLSFIPFLEMLDRFEAEHIPSHITLVVSPILCQLLRDELVISRYLDYLNNQIIFGEKEIDRRRDTPEILVLAQHYYQRACETRTLFTERYQKNIPNVLSAHAQKGRLELMMTAAMNAYLPFYINYPSAIDAQIETAAASHKAFFKDSSQGFWLPELAYCENLDRILRSHQFEWTIIDTHAALLSRPVPETGSFYPLKTKNGLCLLVKDFYAYQDVMNKESGFAHNKLFRSYFDDAGFDLPLHNVINFLSVEGIRLETGYKYYTQGESKEIYNIEQARDAAKKAAGTFLSNRIKSLSEAQNIMHKKAISLSVFPFKYFGRFWYEGWTFIEEVIRQGISYPEIEFITPSAYLYQEKTSDFQLIAPEYSSSGYNGYAEAYFDSSNNWIYRHLLRAIVRMIELSERFDEESGIRERILNQAAREILLATDAELVKLCANSEQNIPNEWCCYARDTLKRHIRNFTTLYEALGNSRLSVLFLTDLEQKNNVFPEINYRLFRRKKKVELHER